jgi:hypothetical protein
MGERRNTIVCAFDLKSPRISAYDIHEWIYTQLKLEENEVTMVQIDGPKRHVYIKFRDNNRLLDVLHLTGGQVEYRHTNGEILIARLETAGFGMRKLRIANLPPEMPDAVIRTVLSSYREVQGAQDVVSSLSLHGGEWHSYSVNHVDQTYPIPYHDGRKQGTGVL